MGFLDAIFGSKEKKKNPYLGYSQFLPSATQAYFTDIQNQMSNAQKAYAFDRERSIGLLNQIFAHKELGLQEMIRLAQDTPVVDPEIYKTGKKQIETGIQDIMSGAEERERARGFYSTTLPTRRGADLSSRRVQEFETQFAQFKGGLDAQRRNQILQLQGQQAMLGADRASAFLNFYEKEPAYTFEPSGYLQFMQAFGKAQPWKQMGQPIEYAREGMFGGLLKSATGFLQGATGAMTTGGAA